MIKEFNALKGLLALMIFIHHLNIYNGGGSLAVAMFFMLGGFLSVIGYKDKITCPEFSYRKYLLCKVIKFYPLHWLLLIVALPLHSIDVISDIVVLVINASLLQSWIPIKSIYFSFNAVSWYLSDTIAFVAVFPFIFRWILSSTKLKLLLTAAIILLVYFVLWYLMPLNYIHRFFCISPVFRIIDYLVGMVAALFYLELRQKESTMRNIQRFGVLLQVLTSVCFILLVSISFLGEYLILHALIYMPLTAIIYICIGLVGGGVYQLQILQFLGKISFAFYLSHQLIISYLNIVLKNLDCNTFFLKAPLALILTLITSYLLTYYFDKNISLWLKKKINQQSMTAQ